MQLYYFTISHFFGLRNNIIFILAYFSHLGKDFLRTCVYARENIRIKYYRVINMGIKNAVALRFQNLCEQQKIRPNELAVRSGVTPSSVYSMLDPSRQNISIVLIKKLCDGLDISLKDFFDSEEFHILDQEIL